MGSHFSPMKGTKITKVRKLKPSVLGFSLDHLRGLGGPSWFPFATVNIPLTSHFLRLGTDKPALFDDKVSSVCDSCPKSLPLLRPIEGC